MSINPMQIVQQMINNNQVMGNPMARNVLELYQKGDINGLQEMANNLAKERGTTVDDIKNQLMQRFGMR